MEDIAAEAGLTKRTLYNNYADKHSLFAQIAGEVLAYAEAFAQSLGEEFAVATTAANLEATLHHLGRRLVLGILRPEVIALRRLLIREAQEFPGLAADYFDRAPGRVLDAMASGFERLERAGMLRVPDARLAAAQFAYLVAGEPLDRAMLVGRIPPKAHLIACAREGVRTFLARYGAHGRRTRTRSPRG
jgi:TetR/AcrR family transcriptional repressor of mexJK operon